MSKYFNDKELGCQCGCGFMPEAALMDKLDSLRGAWGKPLNLNSCARCATHNAKVGGAAHSQHVQGKAADISTNNFTGTDYKDFVSLSRKMGFNGIGQGSSFIHIDIRPTVANWTYGPDGRAIGES